MADRLHDALADIAHRAPEVRIPPGLYRAARRRHRRRVVGWSIAAVLVVALAAVPVVAPDRRDGGVPGGAPAGPPGLPRHLVRPPFWTDTVRDSPAGPASVVLTGEGAIPQADHEDYDLAWWRPGYTPLPSAVVGLDRDSYRIVRGPYAAGTELSPDGRYLLMDSRQVLELATGTARQILPAKPHTTLRGAWSADGKRILYVEDDTTTVLSWPSGQVEWRVRHPEHRPSEGDVALSPDGSMLAVHSNEALSVYRRDGARLWTVTGGRDRIGGRAAWGADGKLVIFRRTDLLCDMCGIHPGTWQVTFVDGATGAPVDGPRYPVIRSALDVRLVTWRDDTAYGVVTYTGDSPARSGDFEAERVALVRLRPGATDAETVLTAPKGVGDMNVATDHVESYRPTGRPEYGFNEREVVGLSVSTALCLAPFLVLLVVLGWWLVRARRRPYGRPGEQARSRVGS